VRGKRGDFPLDTESVGELCQALAVLCRQIGVKIYIKISFFGAIFFNPF